RREHHPATGREGPRIAPGPDLAAQQGQPVVRPRARDRRGRAALRRWRWQRPDPAARRGSEGTAAGAGGGAAPAPAAPAAPGAGDDRGRRAGAARGDGAGPRRRGARARLADPADLEALERRGLVEIVTTGGGSTVQVSHPLYGEVLASSLPSLRRRGGSRGLIGAAGGLDQFDRLRLATWRLESGLPGEAEQLLPLAREGLGRVDHRVGGGRA